MRESRSETRYVVLGSGRLYPTARIARIVTWLLDRLPKSVRDDVLGSYWSPEEMRVINEHASDLEQFFAVGREKEGNQ
jgi:hypothetical protein